MTVALDGNSDYFALVARDLLQAMKDEQPELFNDAITTLFCAPWGYRTTAVLVGKALKGEDQTDHAAALAGNSFMSKVGKFFLDRLPAEFTEKTTKVAKEYGWRGKGSVLSFATWDDLRIRHESGNLKEGKGNVTFVMRPEFVIAAQSF
nr:hypothetical protein 3 [bacterium]